MIELSNANRVRKGERDYNIVPTERKGADCGAETGRGHHISYRRHRHGLWSPGAGGGNSLRGRHCAFGHGGYGNGHEFRMPRIVPGSQA
jgi:hypothetical protein